MEGLPELNKIPCEHCGGSGRVGRVLESWEPPIYGPGSSIGCPECHGMGGRFVSSDEFNAEMHRREHEREVSEARPSWDTIWMSLADNLSKRSTCDRTKVGCVIVSADNHRVLGVGYNGGPKGVFNACLSPVPGQCGHLHAEVNALIKANYSDASEKKAYITLSPCLPCAVAIINAEVSEVIFRDEYRSTDGLDLLRRKKLPVRCFVP